MTSSDDDEESPLEKTIIRSDTVKVKVDANVKVPPCLVLLEGPVLQLGQQWLLKDHRLILGRNPASDIHILDVSLSKSHACFEMFDNKVLVTDLGSTNKTIVNSQVLAPNSPLELKNNDQIRTGNLVFKFLQRGILSETTEKARMQSELEKARSVQESLLPKFPHANYQGVRIGGRYRSATECGGDWWWHWSCADKAFAIIGDATGHGAGAALITSAARSAITTLEHDSEVTIENVYSTLSQTILACSGGKLSMSAFIVEVNLQTKLLRYINASHVPAVILPNQVADVLWNQLSHIAEPISPSLGSPELDSSVGQFEMTRGYRIVLLTDGLTERKNSLGHSLRDRQFYKMLIDVHREHISSQEEFLNSLMKKSDELANHAPQDDDITVVSLDF